ASSATFALNSAEYRFRFPVIGSVLPDGRTKLIQLSGERGPPHQGVFAVLRKMKPMRQIVAAEMMVSASRFTVNYARMILATTRPEQLVDGRKPKPAAGVTPEDIARMEREMEKLHQDYRVVEDTLGETMLVLVVAKGFMTKLLGNAAVAAYLAKHHGDIVGELKRIMEAVASDARGPERE
ncbi:plasmid partitioning protein RepB C-terminal domain-containing protein, partial [Azospirillum argentinense]